MLKGLKSIKFIILGFRNRTRKGYITSRASSTKHVICHQALPSCPTQNQMVPTISVLIVLRSVSGVPGIATWLPTTRVEYKPVRCVRCMLRPAVTG